MTAPSISIPEAQSFECLLSFKSRCAIVTGGSRGLGEAIVHREVKPLTCIHAGWDTSVSMENGL
jgi:hypothetical protein